MSDSWPEPKFLPIESGQKLNPKRPEYAYALIKQELVLGELFRVVELILDGTGFTIVEEEAPTPTVSQDRAVKAWYLIPLLRAWEPEPDDRVLPLLLAEAGRREASSYDIDDAENVIAFLLSRLAAFKKSEVGHG